MARQDDMTAHMAPVRREVIREAVLDYYGRVALAAESDGCACGCSRAEEETAAAPVEAVAAYQGCGDPLVIAPLRAGEVVLDLGCGGGFDLVLAARQVGPAGRVYGLDMTAEMIGLAQANLARAGVDNAAVLEGDLEDIPLPASSVDVIISNCVINLVPDKNQALREAFRVLRPGGRLAVSDIVVDPDLEGLPVTAGEVREALSWAGCIAGALTSGEYRRALADAGFVDVRVVVDSRYRVEDLELGETAPLQLLDRLPAETVRELVARFGRASISARRP